MAEFNRRDFLKGVGALGIAPATVNMNNKTSQIGDLEFNPNEEVAYVAGWSNELQENGEVEKDPMYKSMPQEKWDRLRATDDAANQLSDILDDSELDERYLGFMKSIDEGSDTLRGLDVALMDNAPYTEDEVIDHFPATVVGQTDIFDEELEIPVGFQNVEFENQSHECYDTTYQQFDDVSGGAPIYVPDTDKPGCVAGPYVHDDHGVGWITAYHVADDSAGSPDGRIVEQAKDGHKKMMARMEREMLSAKSKMSIIPQTGIV